MVGYAVLRMVDEARHRPILIDFWYPAATDATEVEQDSLKQDPRRRT